MQSDRAQRQALMRQRRQRRLLPLAAVLVLLVVVVYVATSSSGQKSTPAKTTAPTTTAKPAPYEPPSIKPQISPALPGEGVWTVADQWSPAPPSIETTTFRPDPSNSAITAYVTWMRTSSTLLALYPGYKGPGETTLVRGPEQVPPASYSSLLATFNSGFYEADSPEGFYTNSTLYFPMVAGNATVVRYANGKVDIVAWAGGTTPGKDIEMARQNLLLLVDNGQVTASAANNNAYGVTLGGVPAVWRTGLGIDAHGNLMYVAAPAQTSASLAQILVDMGCVRGMQLDINPEWPIYVTYGGPGAVSPSLFVPNPNQIPNRFLYASTKDFFAVFEAKPGVTAQPW
jgi:hypothetical protein